MQKNPHNKTKQKNKTPMRESLSEAWGIAFRSPGSALDRLATGRGGRKEEVREKREEGRTKGADSQKTEEEGEIYGTFRNQKPIELRQ